MTYIRFQQIYELRDNPTPAQLVNIENVRNYSHSDEQIKMMSELNNESLHRVILCI